MLNAGLTGGIASGKSTVDKMFQEKGAYLIDHDTLAHEAEEPGRPAWEKIVDYFGAAILNEDRTINRRRLGDIVFNDEGKLEKLMDMVHPVVFAEWQARIDDIARRDPRAIIISDIPLLIERGWQDAVDIVLLVYIPREEQIRRLMARNGFSRREADERLRSQMSIDDKLLHADMIINNEGTLEETRGRVDRVWEALLEKERAKRLKGGLFKLKDRK